MLFTITGLGTPIDVAHAYVVTTDTDGSQRYYRGGPSGVGIPDWGNIDTQYGPYTPNTPDWDPGNPPSVTVLDNDQPCSCYDSTLGAAMRDLENANIPYNPAGPNSNTAASYGLDRLGIDINAIDHPARVPGWGAPVLP